MLAGVIRPPQLAALDAYKAWCAAAMGRIGAVGRVHGAQEEGIGTGDERGVFGNEVVVTFDVPGDCAFDVFEVASLNVLGTVAECLLNSQLESVGARACEGAVHPNPAPGGEFDGKHANGLTWREALQWITATRRGVDTQRAITRVEESCRREERRYPQPAVSVARSDDREVAVSQEATDASIEVGRGQHGGTQPLRLGRYAGTTLDGEFALMETFVSHHATSNTALPATRRSSSASAASDTSFHDVRNPICGSSSPAARSSTR